MLKIQTDGTKTPIEAVQTACEELMRTLASMRNQFSNEVMKQKARDDGNDGMMEGMEGGMTF